MSIVDKHGAYWRLDEDGDPIFETYDEVLGLMGAVNLQLTGLFVACLYEKVEDPAFDLPTWSQVKPEALFDDLNEAKAHIVALIAKRS